MGNLMEEFAWALGASQAWWKSLPSRPVTDAEREETQARFLEWLSNPDHQIREEIGGQTNFWSVGRCWSFIPEENTAEGIARHLAGRLVKGEYFLEPTSPDQIVENELVAYRQRLPHHLRPAPDGGGLSPDYGRVANPRRYAQLYGWAKKEGQSYHLPSFQDLETMVSPAWAQQIRVEVDRILAGERGVVPAPPPTQTEEEMWADTDPRMQKIWGPNYGPNRTQAIVDAMRPYLAG